MGVPMGVPYFQIKDILKDSGTTVFSSNFTLYRDISARVFSVLRSLVPTVEQYSIDEAFFLVPEEFADEDLLSYLATLKKTIEQYVGIPVSLGVSDTKTRAKCVNHTAKKSTGVAASVLQSFANEYALLPLGEVWGVGRRLRTRYQAAGINTIGDLITTPRDRLQQLFGVVGVRTQAELAGQVVYQVGDVPKQQKSLMSTRSFSKKTNHLETIMDALSFHVSNVAADLRTERLLASGLIVQLATSRHGDYMLQGGSVYLPLLVPTNDTMTLLKNAEQALLCLYRTGVPYTKTGVVATALVPEEVGQTTLFSADNTLVETQTKTVSVLLDSLTKRFGREALVLGRFTKDAAWQSKHETLSPAYTTRWRDIAKVKAI